MRRGSVPARPERHLVAQSPVFDEQLAEGLAQTFDRKALRPGGGLGAHNGGFSGMGGNVLQSGAEGLNVTGWDQQAPAFTQHLGHQPAFRTDTDQTEGHGFGDDFGPAFDIRSQH